MFLICSSLPISILAMDLFPPQPGREVSDDELTALLASAVADGIRLHREADLLLATICAGYLVDRLRSAGLTVVDCRCAGPC